MSNKVICCVCLNQTDDFCSVKKCKVKANKKRLCDRFVHDNNKVTFKQEIPTTRRPDWYWDREERRRLMKESLRKAQESLVERVQREQTQKKDTKHPLTGDLSQFVTTVRKEGKENR